MGKANKPKGPGYEDWTFWWNYNKDEILQVKSAIKHMQRGPSSSANAFNKKKPGTSVVTPTDEAIKKEIVPALHALFEQKDISYHIQSAAELGLAKIGEESIIPTLKKMARNENHEYHREVQESAGLAFSLLQVDTPEVRSFLIELVKDPKNDGTYVRPFSALSLGLLGDKNDVDRSALTALLDVVSHKESGQDIKPACLVAIGLMLNDKAVPELLTIVKTKKASVKGAEELDEVELSYAVGALGKIGRPGIDAPGGETVVVDEMIKIVDKDAKKWGPNPRRSAAIALGQIGPKCDAKVQKRVLDALKHLADEGEDMQEKNFAIMSIGRLGAATGVEELTRKDAIDFLKKSLEKGRGLTPPFAAIAMGLIGRAIGDEGKQAPEEEIRKPIREKFIEKGIEPRSRGAYAVASGLVRDPLATEELVKALKDRGADKKVRGYCAVALGMIQATDGAEAIKQTLKDDADRDLRVQTAVAAGLMGDASVIPDIVKILEDKDASNYELGSAALALGQIGDESAIKVLVKIAKDEEKKYPDLTRALATVALGQIGDRRDIPTLARVATDINYRAHVPAITELLDIL
jgi:HEAT repeat protein